MIISIVLSGLLQIMNIPEDNSFEEHIEDIIEENIGIKVDLTP